MRLWRHFSILTLPGLWAWLNNSILSRSTNRGLLGGELRGEGASFSTDNLCVIGVHQHWKGCENVSNDSHSQFWELPSIENSCNFSTVLMDSLSRALVENKKYFLTSKYWFLFFLFCLPGFKILTGPLSKALSGLKSSLFLPGPQDYKESAVLRNIGVCQFVYKLLLLKLHIQSLYTVFVVWSRANFDFKRSY